MKLIIIFLVIATLGICFAQRLRTKEGEIAFFRILTIICEVERRASKVSVRDLVNKKSPTSCEAKCLWYCVFRKWGIVTGTGVLDVEETMKIVHAMNEGDSYELQIGRNILYNAERLENDNPDPCEYTAVWVKYFLSQMRYKEVNFIFGWDTCY